MGKLYAYARVSSQSQRLDRQIRNILNYLGEDRALTKLFKEKYTGTKLDRPEFQKLLKILKPGDTVIFDSVSRMSRNAEEGFQLYMELLEMGINLEFINEPHINTDYYKKMQAETVAIAKSGRESVDNLIQSVLTAITEFQRAETKEKIRVAFEQAEKEVTDLHKRISQGIQTTKEKNQLLPPEEQKQIGRRTGVSVRTKKSVEMKNRILKMSKCFSGNMSDKECMEILQIARNTFYKYKLELLAEMESVGSTVE